MPVERSSSKTGSRYVHPHDVTLYLPLFSSASQLNAKLRTQTKASVLPTRAGKVTVKGSNANVSHTINEDERKEFTNHINGVRSRLPPSPLICLLTQMIGHRK